jgi:hypothetical protein
MRQFDPMKIAILILLFYFGLIMYLREFIFPWYKTKGLLNTEGFVVRRLKNGGANSLWPPGSTVAVLTVLQYKNEFLKKAVILGSSSRPGK